MPTSDREHPYDRRVGRWVFDIALVVALVSAAVQVGRGAWGAALQFLLIAALILATRWGNVPAVFAAAFACCAVLSTWAAVAHWYRDIVPADEVIHALTPGSLAAALYFLLARHRVLPDAQVSRTHLRSWTPVLWVTLVGISAATLWEFYEWIIEQISPAGMIVGYDDTIIDLAAGALGSVVAGRLVLAWARRHADDDLGAGDDAGVGDAAR